MFENLRFRGLVVAGAAFATAGLVGCPSYTFLEILPERVTENQIIVEPGKPVPADILFVVDNSCSMEDEQEILAQNFNAFINELSAAEADYRIAVVSTDLTARDAGNNEASVLGVTTSSFSPNPPFVYQEQGRLNCTTVGIGHGCAQGPDAAKRVVASTLPPAEQISTFQTNVRLGSCGSGTEEGIASVLRAIGRAQAGDCNETFLRPGANLVIVILSDEDDQSRGLDIDAAVQQLSQLKPLSQVRIAAIVGAEQSAAGARGARCRAGGGMCGGACEDYGPPQGSLRACTSNGMCDQGELCGDQRQCVRPEYQFWSACHWCSYYDAPDCCSALAGNLYVQFARTLETGISGATGGGVSATGCVPSPDPNVKIGCLIDSICQDNFSETLKKIATDLVLDLRVPLNPPASYPPGVVVKVNGEEWENGVDYRIIDNGATLEYLRNPPPGTGDVVEVFYTLPQ